MTSRSFRPCRALIACVALGATAAAVADPHTPAERAIHYRHSVYHVIEWNVTAMGNAVKGKAPYNSTDFSLRAARVATLVPMLLEGFPPGSYVEGHTLAKPSIWTDRATFESLLTKLGTRSEALVEVAKGGDLATIKPAFNDLVQTCNECHKKFKEKDDD